MPDPLDVPAVCLDGIGPRRAAELEAAGIRTVGDLLCRFPRRYEDRSHLQAIAGLVDGVTATIAGRVVRCGLRRTRRRGFTIYEALVQDVSGDLAARWFNQPFLRDVFTAGQDVVLHGRVETRGTSGLQLTNPQYEIVGHAGEGDTRESAPGLHTGRIVPVHERIGTLTPKIQRGLVFRALEGLPPSLEDPLPTVVRERLALPGRAEALRACHFPPEGTDVVALNRFDTAAQRRLVFEEFFFFQLGLALRRLDALAERKPFAVTVNDRIRAAARAVLPFPLTAGQRSALKEVVDDMQKPAPMNRLLQGDVGAGKTIVALLAALVALENGLQVAFMAPTEILAEQHATNIRALLASARFEADLLTGRTPGADRQRLVRALDRGEPRLVVGTHALIQDPVTFGRLGLVVVDEQHRFGVMQRAALQAKGLSPDVLVMTATPIPRTLALTAYGDLDVSLIREHPPGRIPIETVARPESRREAVYAFVEQQLSAGRQAYLVYPLVEDSDKVDLRAATQMADHLAQEVFPAYRVALLHGRMPPDAKERVMTAFAKGEYDVLVSTTVIEVGIDVANATVMVIEHAERFGLSQLHQLRGRVGRGPHPSACVLLYQPPLSDEARARLKALTETNDGFVIAERDLELRGPGDFFGTRQWGLPRLRVGDLVRDAAVMQLARDQARAWADVAPGDDVAIERVRQTWHDRYGLVKIS